MTRWTGAEVLLGVATALIVVCGVLLIGGAR